MDTRSVLCFLVAGFLGLMPAAALRAQTSNCPEAERIEQELQAAKNEYVQTISEYRQGLFCDKCHRSKSQIERSENKSFEAHLGDVKGQAYTATQEMYDKVQREYEQKRGQLKARQESAQNSCREREEREQERQLQEQERKRREAEQKRQETILKHRETQRQAEEARRTEAEAAEQKRREAEAADQKRREEEAARARAAEEKRREEQERLLQELKQKEEERRRAYEQQMAELKQEIAEFLAESNNIRKSRISEIADEIRGNLSQFENQVYGQESNVWDAAQSGISAYSREKAGELLAEGMLDDENFEAAATETVASGIREGWTAIVDRAKIIEFAEAIGFTRGLKFGQVGFLKTTETTLGNTFQESMNYLGDAANSNFTIEDRSDEILRNVNKSLIKNYLNNLTFLPLGDWLFN